MAGAVTLGSAGAAAAAGPGDADAPAPRPAAADDLPSAPASQAQSVPALDQVPLSGNSLSPLGTLLG
ncbi:hypothetical protein VO63_06865 [Streptomyces showdoensis]|uniref:Uncharacterized protein n=1 Tax=Streptomyces showdoensis TaxID=68268 RepID=A0A2P2GSM6_STREW|nr:hypothetical protein VO63_06865 [Streptomyces showdoensis]